MPEDQAFVWGKEAYVETPNIDWIANHGAIAAHCYGTTPVCSPSRSSFVSGRYPQNTPVVTNNIPMTDDIVTFAELLRRRGYATGYAGKWHLDGPGKPEWAPARKFGFEDNRYMFNRGHWKQMEDTPDGPRVKARNAKGAPTYNVAGADEQSFTTDWLADKTVEFIAAHKTGPFCYMVSIPDPHGPNTVRPPYDTMYANMKFEAPRTFYKPDVNVPSWAKKQRKTFSAKGHIQYWGMVKCIDDNVGKILDALRRYDLVENTIVVFTSDHGDLLAEHARDNKGVPLEGSARIPFLICYPGKIKPGTVVSQVLGTVDFLPTILGLMGVKTDGREEGRDASDFFVGKTPVNEWNDISFVRGTGGPSAGWLAAITPRYKLILSPRDEPWLIDLETDPDEIKNFYSDPDYKKIARDLSKQLARYCREYNDPRATDPKIAAALHRWNTES